MTKFKWRGGIAGSVLIIIAGLVTAIAARTVVQSSAALAAAQVPVATGTDVSNLTTVTSWPDVRAAGVSFVGIEAMDGATVVNTSYASQATGALSQGLFVMPYILADPFKVPTGGDQLTAKAWSVIDSVPGKPYAMGHQYLPIALDMESQAQLLPTNACYGLSVPAMVNWIKEFIAAAKAKAGVAPIIYSNPNWWQACTGDTTAFAADPLWIADYGVASPAIPPGWPGYTLWQTTNTATIAGIDGAADLDQMQGVPQVLTGVAGASGGVRLQTLNSLAGQPVSYTAAAALPAGVSLTPAGLLSWSRATAAGEYQLTVTPTSAASPPTTIVPSAAISLTLRVHGAITLSVKRRPATGGGAIWLQMVTSGPDQKAGFAPALQVTGLPPGLSMNSAGVITGWVTSPGTYTVRVTATDGLGGSGAVSFTWTVGAGGVSSGGGCLNVLGGNTASQWNCQGTPTKK